ncbi:unnamed protein product, partial [Effrenium voratum]
QSSVASSRVGSKTSSRSSSKKLTRGSSKKSTRDLSKASSSTQPGGWACVSDRHMFLQKVRRDLGHRDKEREERLEALMQVRGHALQQQNCWPLWADEQVRRAVLDAIQAPDPERGKSLYTEEGPPPNHPSVRTAACGVLVQLAMDEAVREEMAQDTLVRESLVEALQVEAEEAKEAKEAEETPPEGDGKEEEKEEVGTPFFVQSRAQQLLAMLVPARACAKALQRPQAALGLSRLYEGAEVAEAEEDFEWVEEGEEEEEFEDDPLVETEAAELPARPGSKPEKDRGEKAKAARAPTRTRKWIRIPCWPRWRTS